MPRPGASTSTTPSRSANCPIFRSTIVSATGFVPRTFGFGTFVEPSTPTTKWTLGRTTSTPAGRTCSPSSFVTSSRTFTGPAPYAEGHVCTKAEADALNQTLAENLRNNFAARLKKAADAGEHLDQHDFDAYAEDYSFGSRQPRAVKDPVATEERKLAKSAVVAKLKLKGVKAKDVPEDTLEGYINMAVATGKFRAEAERLVAAERDAKGIELDIEIG